MSHSTTGSRGSRSLTAITGKQINPEAPPTDLGYWGSATIVLLSDGEETGGPDAVAAAELASDAGVHIETVGFGTVCLEQGLVDEAALIFMRILQRDPDHAEARPKLEEALRAKTQKRKGS